ncbi:hypothetical protein V2J09_020804 [Rumex salicifolius]
MASSGGARKRERENPCGICGHYHKYEEGEVCGICGHRLPAASERSSIQVSAFASEILPEFLFLGSYDNASRSELLKTQGISRILNTVPSCTNLYKNSFTYFCLKDDKSYPFDDAIQFLEQCERDRARVLVHCMTGKNRSPAIAIAYLMKCKGWRLVQSYQWVKERRPSIEIQQGINELKLYSPEVHQLLVEYEQTIFGSSNTNSQPSLGLPTFSFGFPKTEGAPDQPAFTTATGRSIFDRPSLTVSPSEFTFGAAGQPAETPVVANNQAGQNAGDVPMDST